MPPLPCTSTPCGLPRRSLATPRQCSRISATEVDLRAFPEGLHGAPDPYFDTAQISVPLGWLADYPSPGTFYSFVGTCQKVKFNRYCSQDVEATATQARSMARTDPSGALASWGEVDRMLVDAAAVIPTDTQIGTVVVSPEVDNVLFRPVRVRSSTRCG